MEPAMVVAELIRPFPPQYVAFQTKQIVPIYASDLVCKITLLQNFVVCCHRRIVMELAMVVAELIQPLPPHYVAFQIKQIVPIYATDLMWISMTYALSIAL